MLGGLLEMDPRRPPGYRLIVYLQCTDNVFLPSMDIELLAYYDTYYYFYVIIILMLHNL